MELRNPCVVFMQSLGVFREQGESIHSWEDIQAAISWVNEKEPNRKEEYFTFFDKMETNLNKQNKVSLMHE
jgi:hypothetical protein